MKVNSSFFKNTFYINKQVNISPMQAGVDSSSIKQQNNSLNLLNSKYNDYLLSFGARVDKGLERFYEVNKSRMPDTVKVYIESLPDKSVISPMEVQRNAFEYLQFAETIEDIKNVYDKEKLFKNLINPQDSKATRGILYSIKENEELLALSNQAALKNKENLTVYLVKKIFLEGKTIDEINADLENDLDDDFKADFKFKNKENIQKNNGKVSYILGSTIKALGIQLPEFEYQQSLRYTRDGYSDLIGDRITDGLTGFYESLSIEERTARAKKSYQSLENWWMSIPMQKKLDMIADDIQAEDLIATYKKDVKQNSVKKNSENDSQTKDLQDQTKQNKKHVKLDGTKLSKDELFIKWATHNLESFEKSLSPEQRETLRVKRLTKMVHRWATMTHAERTDYISKLKSGSEPLRFAMIDAWNNSFELLKDLTLHLKQNQVYKHANILYSSEEFSEFQSKVMREFWQMHTEEALKLGQAIKDSQEKIAQAISQGTFANLKKEILNEKNIRIKNLENYKNMEKHSVSDSAIVEKKADDYKIEFKKTYSSLIEKSLKSVPKNLYEDLFKSVFQTMPESIVRLWTRHLQGEELPVDEMLSLQQRINVLNEQNTRYNLAFEAAVADTVYNCSNDAIAYNMSKNDLKIIMKQLEKGYKKAFLPLDETGKTLVLNFVKNKVDASKINRLYELYKKDVSKREIDEIIYQYFGKMDAQTQSELRDYINQYGQSIFILFSDKSLYSTNVKDAFYEKFKNNMPKTLAEKVECFFEKQGLAYEKELQKLSKMRTEKFYFLPQYFVDSYNAEVTATLRNNNEKINFDLLELSCKKRTNIKDNGKLLVIPKHTMFFENRLKSLAMTQALADVLYEITDNEVVYFFSLEQLAENIELFNLCRTFPTEERTLEMPIFAKHGVTIKAYKRPDIRKITTLYNEYYQQIQDLMKEIANGCDVDIDDFVYILNPEEDKMLRDIAVKNNLKQHLVDIETAKSFAKEYYVD